VIPYIGACWHKADIISFEDQLSNSKAEMQDYSRRSPKPSFFTFEEEKCARNLYTPGSLSITYFFRVLSYLKSHINRCS